jgi:N-formylglutamate deformylase
MSQAIFSLHKGRSPLVVSMPHVGLAIPPDIAGVMTRAAEARDDTDWHLETLYDFLEDLGASVLVPVHSRYVVDLNRPADGRTLYPGQDNTPVCPVDTFDRVPLYQPGREPDEGETQRRLQTYWRPYHAALADELARVRDEHGTALLWDAHSVRSVVPRFFEGRLPDLNFGTVGGSSCGPGLGELMLDIARSHGQYSAVLNGRFVGGFVTRSHARPGDGIHAVQLELSQITYMDEAPPYAFDPVRADALRPLLRSLLQGALDWSGTAR